MTAVVLDSNNLDAIVADAQGDELPETKLAEEEKPAAEAKDGETKPEPKEVDDPDDIEGDDGLTPRQKREFSASMLKTIGKKHRQMKEAEEFAAAQYSERKLAEQRAEQMQRELDGLKVAAPAADPEADKPTRDAFEDDAAYIDAMVQWRLDTERKKMAQEDAQRRETAIIEAAKGRVAKAMDLVPDYKAVTEAVDTIVPPVVSRYMLKSELFAELGYYFAKTEEGRAALLSLSKLEPDEQLVKVGKIESTLAPFGSKPKADTKTTDGKPPKAPSDDTGTSPSKTRSTAPVITPLNGSSGTATDPNPRDMNTRETITTWQKSHKANLNLRKRH